MAKLQRAYGIGSPFKDVFPVPVLSSRVPTTADLNFSDGQVWINQSSNITYIKVKSASGSATWGVMSAGSSDVDTINGLAPAAGNILIDGGSNITDSNAGNTVTLNLNAAITLATSVSSPIFTSTGAIDTNINAVAGQDIIVKLGDAAAANKISFVDSASAEVASIDSNGGFTTTGLTFTGLLTANASATILTAGATLDLASDNSADAVILGGGTSARAITIGQDAAAHTIAIGQAAAGAISLDSAAGISLDAAAASNFTVAGAGIDLSLISGAGRVIVNAEEAAANAITLLSAAGGIDADCALQMNLASSQAAADAIRLNASGGGVDIDAAGAIALDGTAASNFSLSGAGIDLSLISAAGRVIINGEEAAVSAVELVSAAGGISANSALQLSLVSTQAAVADSIVIDASAADGGIDMDCGTGGFNLTSTGVIDLDAAGVLSINSSAAAINMGNDAVAQAINIGTGAAARTVTVGNTTGASGLVLQAGTGDITITGVVKEINAEFLFSSGTDLVVSQSPIMQASATTGVAPTGVAGAVNLMHMQDGCLMEQFIIGTQTIIAPRMSANGLAIELDNTNAEGAEYNFGARANAKHAYTIGTSPAFFVEAKFKVADLSGCAPLMIGFRKVEANNAVLADYTDYFCAGLNSATSAVNVVLLDELNAGGQTATSSTDAWGSGDGTSATIRVLVSASGVCTYTIDGGAPSATNAMTFDNADVVMPMFHFLNGADVAGEVALETFKCGFQA